MRLLWSAWAIVATFLVLPTIPAISQQTSSGATIEGALQDDAGKPVSDASIQLKAKTSETPRETQTNAAGSFAFSALPAGSYSLSAEKSGLHSRPIPVLDVSAGDRRHVGLVLDSEGHPPANSTSPSPTQAMSFSDTPDFTVAGVTDWTAVGGHGSDSILRTSEDLARETLALKAQNAGGKSDSLKKDDATEGRLRAALAGHPGTFAANHQLGNFYLASGRSRDALPLLQAAYQIDPADDSNERDLALACEETGDLNQAREHIQNLLQRKDNADLHRTAGDLYEKSGDPLSAVKEYQQAVNLDPSEQNYFAWGSELLLHRAVWQAAEVFKSGVKAHPKSPRLLTALGSALFAGALYDEAARSLCQASDLDPANPEPYIFMGKIEIAAPAPLPCIEPKLARHLKENPDNSLANYFYAMAIWKQQQLSANKITLQQVEALLTKAVSLDAQCFDGYLQLGILAASQRDYDKAIQLYSKAIDVHPQLAEAHYRLGVAYDRLGQQENARREYQLHDQIQKRQAATVEQQRRDVKQFVVVQGQPAKSVTQ
jgi:Flp pilus assembly protein TadD